MNKLLAAAALTAGLFASSSVMATDKTLTLTIKNMDCAACPHTVKASLQAVPGVKQAVVSHKEKTATVVYDDAKTGVQELTTATTNAGYPSTPRS